MIKVFLNKDGSIAKYESVDYIYASFETSDTLVICNETKEICKIQDSSQWKKELAKLENKKELDRYERGRYILLWGTNQKKVKPMYSETLVEKEIEKAELEFLLS